MSPQPIGHLVKIDIPTASFRADVVFDLHKPIIRDLVTGQDQAPWLGAWVVDMFCTPMIDVGKEFGIPTYMLFPSNAALLRS
ncbi:hypothetical protein Tco_0564709 [Tanacetum coccineum]